MAKYVHFHDAKPVVYEDECPICNAEEINLDVAPTEAMP